VENRKLGSVFCKTTLLGGERVLEHYDFETTEMVGNKLTIPEH
jgi:hypothetical protein